MSEFIVVRDTAKALAEVVERLSPDKCFLLADANTMPIAEKMLDMQAFDAVLAVPAGEDCKTVDCLLQVLNAMETAGLTRGSAMVNFGGGAVSDLGGLAAALYKRGIKVINIATTLLAAVDAAIGGKTGVNFAGLKNELGVVRMPNIVIASIDAMRFLPDNQWLNGYGEVVKYSMMMTGTVSRFVRQNVPLTYQTSELEEIITDCAKFKMRVVSRDAYDRDLRHVLNLGHTIAHAVEAYGAECGKPVSHGIAVGRSLPVVAYIGCVMCGSPRKNVALMRHLCCDAFGLMDYGCDDIDRLIELMRHDKKNTDSTHIKMVLPQGGFLMPDIDCQVPEKLIREAINFNC